MRPDLTSPRWILGAVAAAISVFLALHVINKATADGEWLRMDAEQNLVTWFGSALFLIAALASFGRSGLTPDRRVAWLGLGALMLALSIDEVAMIHERLEDAGDSRLSFFILQPVIAVGAVALLVAIMRDLDPADRPLIAAAIAALILAQAGSIAYSQLELEGAVGAAQGLSEEILELAVPGLVLAAALPRVWAWIGRSGAAAPPAAGR